MYRTETSIPCGVTPSDLEDIRNLLTHFAWYTDSGDGEALARLFLPDGTLETGGREYMGRGQIAQDAFVPAFAGRKSRHLWSNLRITRVDQGMIEAVAMQMSFEQVSSGGSSLTQVRVHDLFDTFVRNERSEWRFAARRVVRALAFDA